MAPNALATNHGSEYERTTGNNFNHKYHYHNWYLYTSFIKSETTMNNTPKATAFKEWRRGMSDEFKVLNSYSGRITGKQMFQAEAMALEYVEKHLGKKIKIIHCDHERIKSLESENNSLKSRIAELESELELEREMVADLVFYSGAIINPVTRCLSYNWRKLKEIVGRARQRIKERKA